MCQSRGHVGSYSWEIGSQRKRRLGFGSLGFDVLAPGVPWYLVREYFENTVCHAAGVFGSYSVL